MNFFKKLVLLLFAVISFSITFSQIESAASGNWTSTSSWVGGVVPTNSNDIVIKSGHTLTLQSNRNVSGIEIEPGGTLSLTSGVTLNFYPGAISLVDFVNNGTISSSGLATIKSTSILRLSGSGTFDSSIKFWIPYYLNIPSSATITINNELRSTGGGFVKIVSGGKLILNGVVKFEGTTTLINEGIVEIKNSNFCTTSPSQTPNSCFENSINSTVIYNYDGEFKSPVQMKYNSFYNSHFYNVSFLGQITSSSDFIIYNNFHLDGTFTHTNSGNIVSFNGAGSGTFTGSGTFNGKNISSALVNGLTINGPSLNIDEVLSNSNSSVITTNSSSTVTLNSNQDDAAGMLNVSSSNSYIGDITIERFFNAGGTNGNWVNFASAIKNTSVLDLRLGVQPSPYGFYLCGDFTGAPYTHNECGGWTSVYFYDESIANAQTDADKGFVIASASYNANTSYITPAIGTLLWGNNGDNKITLSGLPELGDGTGNVAITLNSSGNNSWNGWNLISNPFPCSIDYNELKSDNSFLPTSYYSVQGGNFVAGTGIIPHSQGFIVKSTSSTNEILNFNLSQLSSTHNSTYYRSSNGINKHLVLKVTSDVNDFYDLSRVYAANSFSNSFDLGEDMYKLFSPYPDYAPNIYFLDNQNNSLERICINNNQSNALQLGVKIGDYAPGNYTINFENLQSFMIGSCILLEDLHTGIITDLRQDSSYTFISDTSSTIPRFNLLINTAYDINVENLSCFNDSSGVISLSGNGISNYYYKLINSSGITIDSLYPNNDSLSFNSLSSGFYSLVTNDSNSCSLHNQEIIITEPIETISGFNDFSDTLYVDSSGFVQVPFFNTSSGSSSFFWDFGDGSTSFDLNPSHLFSPGIFNISLHAYSDSLQLCSSIFSKTLNVIDSVNSLELKDYDKNIIDLKITNNILLIKSLEPFYNGSNIKIFDLNGKLLVTKNIIHNCNSISIDLSQYSSGFYILRHKDKGIKFSYTSFR